MKALHRNEALLEFENDWDIFRELLQSDNQVCVKGSKFGYLWVLMLS